MLTLNKLRELAVENQTTELNIRREYVQHLFLSYFYQQKESREIFFKGGTAFRIIHHSPRFSEDLDFSSPYKNIKPIEDAVVSTLKEIEREGIQTEIIESKGTTGGYLAIIDFKLDDHSVAIQIEVSNRAKAVEGEAVAVVSNFLPVYTVMQLKLELLVNEKIQALLSRKKPRDFYDLYFILRAKLTTPKQRKILSDAQIELKKTRINFEGELKQFLPRSHWAIIRDFKKSLEQEVDKFL